MESTHESIQTKVGELFEELKKLSSNYKLTKLNMNIVLYDTKNNKNFTFNIDEKLNFSMSSESVTEQEGGILFTENTLSSGIFNTSMNSEDTETQRISISTSDIQSTITEKNMERKNNRNSADIFKGGFKKPVSNKQSLSNDVKFSSTSELNTTVKNIFTKQKGGANLLSDTSATSVTSVTSDNKISKSNYNFSPTSMSATSDLVGGVKSEFSATSMSATSDFKVGGVKSEFSATSMSATSDNKIGEMLSEVSATSMSATFDNKVGGMRSGMSETSFLNSDNVLSNVSATSLTNAEPMTNIKGGFNKSNNIESTLTKMDLIRKKIKELESISETEIFQKNKVTQSGGSHKNKGKEVIGINSSSTSSLCE